MEKDSDARFMKIVSILILATLVVAVALLVSLQLQLHRSAALAAAPATDATTGVVPAPVTPALQAAASAPVAPRAVQSTREPARRSPAPLRHYTQVETNSDAPQASFRAEEPSAVAVAPEPARVAPAVNPPVAREPQPIWDDINVPAGTVLTVRLINTLDSRALRVGDPFTAVLDEPISSLGRVLAQRGNTVEGRIVSSEQAGRVSGLSELRLELDRLLLADGRSVEIVTDVLTREGESSRRQDAAKVGTGAAIGAAIGAIAGGRKGAAIGAATGAGAGTGQVLLSRGKPVILEPETRLSFQLRAPFHVRLRSDEASAAVPSVPVSGEREDDQRPYLRRF